MKTISTLLVCFSLTSSVFASNFRATAALTIKSTERLAIVVVVDEKRYSFGSNSIMIEGLDACDHNVTVYQERVNGSMNCFGGKYDVLFQSSIALKPRTNLMISIDDCGAITMNESRVRTPRIGDTWKGNQFEHGDYANFPGFERAIAPTEWDRVLWAISKESEMNRIKSAEQIINTNYFTVNEVKQLLRLFHIESDRLELAKLAYRKTVDPTNYYAVNDVFDHDDSRSELDKCIQGR